MALVRDRVTWGPEFGDSPFFEGEVEPCINGLITCPDPRIAGRVMEAMLTMKKIDIATVQRAAAG